jgi:hypothetical protein
VQSAAPWLRFSDAALWNSSSESLATNEDYAVRAAHLISHGEHGWISASPQAFTSSTTCCWSTSLADSSVITDNLARLGLQSEPGEL